MHRLAQLAVVSAALVLPTVAHADDKDGLPMKSPAMVATGIGLMTVGTVAGAISSPILWVFTHELPSCTQFGCTPPSTNVGMVVGLTVGVVSGALAILGGIPLVYFGAKHEHGAVAWLTPGGIAGRF